MKNKARMIIKIGPNVNSNCHQMLCSTTYEFVTLALKFSVPGTFLAVANMEFSPVVQSDWPVNPCHVFCPQSVPALRKALKLLASP